MADSMNPEVDRIDLYSGTPGSEEYAGSIDAQSAKDIMNDAPTEDVLVSQTERPSLEELDSVLAALEDRVDAIAEVLKVHGIHVE